MQVLKGRPDTVAVATLPDRVVLREAKAAVALLQEVRAGKGKARVTMSSDRDAGIDLSRKGRT